MFTSRSKDTPSWWHLPFDRRNPPKIDLLFLGMALAIIAAVAVLIYQLIQIIRYLTP